VAQQIQQLSVSKAEHQQLQSYVNTLFKGYVQDGKLKLVNFDDALCTQERCSIGSETKSYYSDNNHLTTDGELLVVDALVKNFN